MTGRRGIPHQSGPDRAHLVDTSVWVDWLRNVEGPAADEMYALLDSDAAIATTEPVVMELLAGAQGSVALDRIDEVLAGIPVLSVSTHIDFHRAASLYREARARGRTVRRLLDCLIAAVALRHDAVLVHKDADFETLAEIADARWLSCR